MKPGTSVKIGERTGVVVFDSCGLCKSGSVLVEYNGSINLFAVEQSSLQVIGEVSPILSEKCENCVFSSGSDCMRYKGGRIAMLLSSKNGKKVPNGTYPDCFSF